MSRPVASLQLSTSTEHIQASVAFVQNLFSVTIESTLYGAPETQTYQADWELPPVSRTPFDLREGIENEDGEEKNEGILGRRENTEWS